uniref:CCR4-NOT transcription complex subunit 3 n=1 Tax=Ascaris suum TaxID=6253 RepID=F1KUZ1_ASCSU
MAEKRKLLNEIDKCFKKIEEGVELFEETMSKMQEANSDNQREKFQDDLKKEIKKLQRLRDQIKGWQNSSDIKDKDRLTYYRKLIEQRMEQFKDIERENKTKPHSKQGLSAEEKLDPREKEKADTVEWLQCQIRYLEDESDKTESQIESLSTSEQTRKKGKRDDPKKGEEKLRKLDDLRKHLERMKFHVSKLEICMRLVNNETLESKRVMDALKEQFEMYIEALDPESENDPESFDPESSGVYDELDLQSYTPQLGGAIFGSGDAEEKFDNNGDGKSSPSVSPTPVLPKEMEDSNSKQRHLSGETAVSLARQTSTTRSTPATPLKLNNQVSVEGCSLSSPPPPATPPPPPGIPYNVAAGLGTKGTKGAVVQTTVKQPVEVVRQPSGVISVTTTTTTTASVAQQAPAQPIPTNNDENVAPTPLHVDMPPTLPSQPAALSPAVPPASGSSTPESNLVKRFSISSSTSSQQEALTLKVAPAQANSAVDVVNAVVQQQASALTSANAQQQPQQQQQLTVAASVAATLVAPPSSATLILPPPSLTTAPAIGNSAPASATLPAANEIDPNALRQVLRIASTQDARSQLPQSAIIPAWLGASPLGRAPITPEHDAQLNLLEHALTRTPLQMDSEKPRSYLPKMPCATASYYPQSPPANADTLEYYLRLSPETLFFTFYYMEGSRAQLLAAKALKKLSWRFHTKYLMWFQRHEEPKQITDDYEQGTYVYFDFEKWSQRKKEQFTFEYRYLEDKDFD